MATSTFMNRNVKIKYRTDPKTGAVTVMVNNKPTQAFTDKSKAREWTAQNKGTAKEAKTQLKDIYRVSRTGGKSTAEIMAEAYLLGNEIDCIINNDVSYISARDVARILKLGVEWNGNTKTVKLEKGN